MTNFEFLFWLTLGCLGLASWTFFFIMAVLDLRDSSKWYYRIESKKKEKKWVNL